MVVITTCDDDGWGGGGGLMIDSQAVNWARLPGIGDEMFVSVFTCTLFICSFF